MTIDKSPTRIKELFNRIAFRYDLLNHILSFGRDRAWRKKTVKLAVPNIEGDILDVCTGTADFAIAYARKHPERSVRGIDFSIKMIDAGKKRVDRENLSNRISLAEGDAMALQEPSDHYSLVNISYGIRNTENYHRALTEMVRVAKPGGLVAILEFSMPEYKLFGFFYRFYFKHILPRLGAAISGERIGAYRHLHDSVCEFPQKEKLAEIMRQVGLENIRQFPMTFGIVTLSIGEKKIPSN